MSEEEKTVNDLYVDKIDNTAQDIPEDSNDNPPATPSESQEPPAAEPPAGETPPEGDPPPPDPSSGIERILSDYGVEGGMIIFEDGEKVHIDKLNDEEQYKVLHSIFTEGRPSIESEFDLSDDEISLLNMIRDSGGSVEDALTDIVNKQVDMITTINDAENINWNDVEADSVYMTFLKEVSPDKSEEELLADLATAKETSTFNDVVDSKRKEFTSRQKISKDQKLANLQHSEEQQLEEDRRVIVNSVSSIDNVAGFEITDDVKNILLEDMVEVNSQGDARLLGEIFSKPENIFKVAWFMKYGESSINEMEKYYRQELTKAYSRGRAEALGRLPESTAPSTLGGIRNIRSNANDNFNSKPEAKEINDLYLD